MFDVVIVGGSFSGLAVATRLRGQRVLIVDQHPLGSHQSSTCGAPLRLARQAGAEEAIQEVHETAIVHFSHRIVRFALPEPYVTFDYRTFCECMFACTEAEFLLARATDRAGGRIVTTRGEVEGRFLVDASGWRAFAGKATRPPGELPLAGRGIETELPARLDVEPGLHFYFTREIIDRGYAWVFPCGTQTRIGLGSSGDQRALRRRLNAFVEAFGHEVAATHGGVMPIVRRSPLVDEAFVVGDAAGQCLPLTAEGIRTAIVHGWSCGALIAQALRGEITAEAARRAYGDLVRKTDRAHRRLLFYMTLTDRTPERLLALAARLSAATGASNLILKRYLIDTGWPMDTDKADGPLASLCDSPDHV